MKSNQRKEAEQLIMGAMQQNPRRKLAVVKEDRNQGSSVSYSLLNKSRQSKLMKDRSVRVNRCSAKAINNCIHTDRKSSLLLHNQTNSNKNDDNLEYSTQTMYNSTTTQSPSNKRHASVQPVRQMRQTQASASKRNLSPRLSNILRPSLSIVVIALALSSCIYITHIQAFQNAEASDSSSSPSTSPLSSSSSSSSSQAASSSSQSLAASVASSALTSLSSAIISAALQDGKSSSSDKSSSSAGSGGLELAPPAQPSSASSPSASSSSSSSSGPSSIAASLSSAVASAAAAAAVAAAQNSLSGSDARSLLTGSSSSSSLLSPNTHRANQHHHSRNSGLNLALKLADAIPEVPYNILHNMKKLDHAAPFYNVGNKVSYSGNSKESTHGFLSSALHASGGLGGAAEQLSSLFRSPIWKRIADGYGEFTSEFRSLFRGPPTPMKGTSSSTTKLLRDISVPALLMLLASTIPNDWRPVRTRRKSLVPTDLAPTYHFVEPATASASSEQPNYSVAPQLYSSAPNFNLALQQPQQQQQIISQQQQINRGLNPLAQLYNQMDQSTVISNQARINDIDLQQADTASTVAWLQPSVAQSEPVSHMHNYDTQMHQIQLNQLHSQQQTPQQLQTSMRRFGDSLPTNLAVSFASHSEPIHSGTKPVNGEHLHLNNLSASASSSSPVIPSESSRSSAGSYFSSLTSGLVNQVGNSKLMNRIMNANTASLGGDNMQPSKSSWMSIGPVYDEHRMRRDHLDDKHRYSLVNNVDDDMQSRNSLNGYQQVSSQSKPFSLSAVSQAFSSMLANSPLKSGSTLTHGGSLAAVSNKMFTLNGNNDNMNLQNSFMGDKMINHHDTILRRNHQSSGAMEQRELSKLIPQSWRAVVKRTVNSVQEQASTQWRSIEGQLANWVQDKLKTIPAVAAASSGSSSSSSSSASPAPVSNILASVGSTALNILGLGAKSTNGAATVSNSSNSAPIGGESTAASSSSEDSPSVLKTKNDATKTKQPASKGGLAGVANMIVNTLAIRPVTPQSSQKAKATASSAEASSSSTYVSQYPTLTGVQPGASQSTSPLSSSSGLVDLSSSSSSSGTASTVAGQSVI